MLNRHVRPVLARVVDPVARGLLRAGVGPDAVTVVGMLGVVVASLWFFPRGQFLAGTLVVTVFVLSDLLDGTMARLQQRQSQWGAYLDSTCDRIGDAAVLLGIGWWALRSASDGVDAPLSADHATVLGVLTLSGLVVGFLVSYARARAEGLGVRADIGIAERAERLILVLVATGLVGLGLPHVALTIAMGVLTVLGLVTVGQRSLAVRREVG
ncbi:phosphatidylinositol phosphate synthase [Kytococcus sedentarius]|uniref:phosphatidylinositol phosphate synthase n=1 Tax=Kytococcus sedentarius TaxID=1276 RepID=UPI0035BBF585